MSPADLIFGAASALAAVSTLLAVTRRNPVYSAAWMLVSLFAVAVVYLLLHATFLFVVQVLLYAGAILVLFVFVIMLLNPGPADLESDRPPAWVQGAALAFSLALLVVLVKALYGDGPLASIAAFTADGAPPVEPANYGDTVWVGSKLYDRFLVPFEMISVLIMASIAAVILLAKRRLDAGPANRDGEPAAEPTGGHGHDHALGHAHAPAAIDHAPAGSEAVGAGSSAPRGGH